MPTVAAQKKSTHFNQLHPYLIPKMDHQCYDRQDRASELLHKLENLDRSDHIEDILERLNLDDIKSKKSTQNDKCYTSDKAQDNHKPKKHNELPLDLVAELLMSFANHDHQHGSDRHHCKTTRNVDIQDLLSQLVSGDHEQHHSTSRRDSEVRDILSEVVMSYLARERGMERTRYKTNYMSHGTMDSQDQIQDLLFQLLGTRKNASTRNQTQDLVDELLNGTRVERRSTSNGYSLLERVLDLIENTDNRNHELGRTLLRIVLESLGQEASHLHRTQRFSAGHLGSRSSQYERHSDHNGDMISMLIRRIMLHLLNDVESARMELEILTILMNKRDNHHRRLNLIQIIRENLADLDHATRREMEKHDIIRAILRLRNDNRLDDGSVMDVLIVHLLRKWCTDFISQSKITPVNFETTLSKPSVCSNCWKGKVTASATDTAATNTATPLTTMNFTVAAPETCQPATKLSLNNSWASSSAPAKMGSAVAINTTENITSSTAGCEYSGPAIEVCNSNETIQASKVGTYASVVSNGAKPIEKITEYHQVQVQQTIVVPNGESVDDSKQQQCLEEGAGKIEQVQEESCNDKKKDWCDDKSEKSDCSSGSSDSECKDWNENNDCDQKKKSDCDEEKKGDCDDKKKECKPQC
ncbi:hypothetical protein DFS34DRAFT_601902 [Phlyctochytrium arcticum]|nr:hypothetical protein DFS34DRAFT_601902 [Phlyctochytrium arcticum]